MAFETNLDGIELAAIAKASGELKKARAGITIGQHDGVALFAVEYDLDVADDTEKTPTVSIPLLPALALVAKRAGATGPAAVKAIVDAVAEALTLGKDATADLLAENGVGDAVVALKAKLAADLPKTPVKGAIKGNVRVTRLTTVTVGGEVMDASEALENAGVV